jgi:hypothetical protein
VVIGIVAVISVVVVLTLNPAQLLRQARDSNRLSDLNTLTKAVSLYETDQPGGSLGTASTTYFSIVDPAATSTQGTDCANTGLTPPSGWAYRCAASSSLRKTDGTGWVPVNFDQMSFKALAALPVDPTNTTSSGLYYSYTPGGSFALTATLESDKYLTTKAKEDGGYDPGRLEMGSNLALVARSQGLQGWWRFDDSAGDFSGNGNNGSLSTGTSTAAWQSTSSCKIGKCLEFDGADDVVTISSPVGMDSFEDGSFIGWIYSNDLNGAIAGCNSHNGTANCQVLIFSYDKGFFFGVNNDGALISDMSNDETNWQVVTSTGANVIASGSWNHVAIVPSAGNSIDFYANGVLVKRNEGLSHTTFRDGNADTIYIGRHGVVASQFNGRLDDIRMYSRALQAKEIEAIYNATR